MPPLKTFTPMTLEKLCLIEIVNHLRREVQLCNFVQRYENTSLLLRNRGLESSSLRAELDCYLDKLPPLLNEIVRQDITNILLSKPSSSHLSLKHVNTLWHGESQHDVHSSTILQILAVVLNKDIKVIEFADAKRFIFQPDGQIWQLITQCNGLRRLVLHRELFRSFGEPCILRRFMTSFVGRLTVNCQFLTELVLKDLIQHWDVLKIIGKNCKCLTKLDLTGSRISCADVLRLCVDPDTVPAVTSDEPQDPWRMQNNALPPGVRTPLCRTLRELILTGTNVRARGAGLLLQLIPSLTSLGDLIYTAAGLKNIYALVKAKKCKTLNLKHAFYRGPSNVKLKILANCCPKLESLVLGSKTDRRIQCYLHLHSLSFKMLTNLSLENIHSEDIVLALQHVPNLVVLKMNCSGVDLSAVSRYCPSLRDLTVSKEPERDMAHLSTPPGTIFAHLEHVKLSTAVSAPVATYVLRHALCLRTVKILRVRDAGDDTFKEWLEMNTFQHLETFMIRYAGFTRHTVDRLLETCPKLIKLGELGGWDIRSWECRRIKDAVSLRGYNLDVRVYMTGVTDLHDILDGNASSSDGDSDSILTDEADM